ncbi:hypothetical protein OSB04_032159 [Centaurea solstitialis]|uniref:Integrase catalytic domain-containing protein n=1 Tax=Centaurea solstitialis TaxID=347529 RepID=A0AA38SN42_9ASTR|nr:hypothetical protein OSB04_032159 [Centaurea solstitialis]
MSDDDGNSGNDLTLQLANLLKNSQPKSPKLSDNLQINLKLNSQNYALWTRMIRVAIGGRSKSLLDHLTSNPPDKQHETYEQWEQDDLVVFSWLIQNIEPALAGNLTEFPIAKSLWDALTFNLHVRANDIKQNNSSLEEFWITLQGVWGEIDRIDPNPMTCPADIQRYSKIRSEQKLFQFLNAIDRKEIIRLEPLPTVEAAYATVRKEAAHQNILGATLNDAQGIVAGLIATEMEGLGLATKGYRRGDEKKPGSMPREDKSHLKCDHCGMTKHTKKGTKATGMEKGKTSTVTSANDGNRSTGFGGMAAAATAGLNGKDDDFSMCTGTGVEGEVSTTPSYPQSNFFEICKQYPKYNGNANVAQNHVGKQNKSWIFDCGATDTMTYELSDLTSLSKPRKTYIETANGGKMDVKTGGTIEISSTLRLSNCLYVPSLSHKILSISHVTKELNCSDIRTGRIIGRGTERHGLYYMDEVTQNGTVMLAHGSAEREAWLWHRRLGHPSTGYLHILFPEFFPSNSTSLCETCVLAKSHRKTFKPNNTRVELPFSLIHSDVWGPASTIGGQNFRFFLLDRFTVFYAMIQTQFQKNIQIFRSDNGGEFVNTHMKQFFQSKGIIHQTTCPHTPEQNGVAERKNRILLEMTRALLIESQVPQVYWPEALATATYLLNRLPTKILKLKTPLETLEEYTKIPPVLTLEPNVFGCTTFVHIPKSHRNKLDPCAEKCVFVGYGVNRKGYRCYNPETRHMFTTMNCHFLETKYYYSSKHNGQREEEYDILSWLKYVTTSEESCTNHSTNNESPEIQSNPNISVTGEVPPNLMSEVSDSHPSDFVEHIELTDDVNATCQEETKQTVEEVLQEHEQPVQEAVSGRYVLPPRANRGVPPKRYSPEKQSRSSKYPMTNIAKGNLSTEEKTFVASLYSEEIHGNIEQALKSKNWKDAMETEMEALVKNKTWEKCALPQGKKPVGCRWVFTIKYKPDGTIERHKARLVAKGYTQTYGIDYLETFSPVAKINTIRVLFSITTNEGWPLHQFDVKNAFLHGELKEEVYMEAPPGFSDNFKTGEVCRLKKSLYGLKQSPRAWFGRFTLAMKKYGFKQSNSDHTLFLKRKGKFVTCLIIYVDDMIITGNDKEEITKLKEGLFTEFEMKDLGELKYFLGIEVLRSKQGIFICQKKYVLDYW